MREIDLQDRIRALGTGDLRLFRNNCGVGTSASGQVVRYGLNPGSPDLIGWRKTVITLGMVGQTVAVAVGIEVKTPSGRVTAGQARFIQHMQDFGALAGIARSVDDVRAILDSGCGESLS